MIADSSGVLAGCLKAIGHAKRLEIVQYCKQPRTFSEITFNLRLNPNSFKFHSKILIDQGLVRKIERGKYETTKLGKMLIAIVDEVQLLILTQSNAIKKKDG